MVAGLSARCGFVVRSSRRPPSPRPHGRACHRAGGRPCAGRVGHIGGPRPVAIPGRWRAPGWASQAWMGAPLRAPQERWGKRGPATRGGMRAMGEAKTLRARRHGIHRCSRRPTGHCGRSLECCNGDRRRGIRHHAVGGVRWHRHGQKKAPQGHGGGRMVESGRSFRVSGSAAVGGAVAGGQAIAFNAAIPLNRVPRNGACLEWRGSTCGGLQVQNAAASC